MGFLNFLRPKAKVLPPIVVPDDAPFLDNEHSPIAIDGVRERQAEIKAALASTGRTAGAKERERISVSLHKTDERGAPIEVRTYGYLVGTVPKGDERSLVMRRMKSAGSNTCKTVAHVVTARGVHYVEIWPFLY